MFAAIYRWKIKPGRDNDFIKGWYLTSAAVRERYGAIGSRLHKAADGLYVSYGRWAVKADREAYFADLAVSPEGFELMQSSISEEMTPIDMEIVGNLLGREAVPDGLFVDLGAALASVDSPVLPSSDVAPGASVGTMTLRFEIFPEDFEATRDFYTRVLRFRMQRYVKEWPGPYGSFSRGAVVVGAAQRVGNFDLSCRRPPVGVEIVLEVDDVGSEHAAIVASGWPIEDPLEGRPWGLTDFRILDPSGYYIRITNRSADQSPPEV